MFVLGNGFYRPGGRIGYAESGRTCQPSEQGAEPVDPADHRHDIRPGRAATDEDGGMTGPALYHEEIYDLYEYGMDLPVEIIRELLALPRKTLVEDDVAPTPAASEPSRNDPCPCGSGRKYKKCCMR
jgi:hypothetical protein